MNTGNRIFHIVAFAVLAAVIGYLQFISIERDLYWTIWWMDVLLHFLAGIFIAYAVLLVNFSIYGWRGIERGDLKKMFWTILLVGIGWEIFEYVNKIIDPENYWTDTFIDIAMDFLGALSVYVFMSVMGKTARI